MIRTLLVAAALALPQPAPVHAAEPILASGRRRRLHRGNRRCGTAFCVTLKTGKHAGKACRFAVRNRRQL